MALDELSRLFDLDRKINEAVEHESESLDDFFFGDGILEEAKDLEEEPEEEPAPEESPKEVRRGRGRPKGVKEVTPRKRRPNTEKIVERIQRAIRNLEAL